MKPTILALILALGATAANAGTISPPGPATADGSALVVAPGMTTAAAHPMHWTINVTAAGIAKTTGAVQPAGPVIFTNLPAKWKPGVGQALSIRLTWGVPGFPQCDVNMPLSLQNGTVGLNYSNATTGCEISWGGHTNPTLSVAP